MKVTIDIPDYLSVEHWKMFNSLEHLTHLEKMTYLLSKIGRVPEDEIKKWKAVELKEVYSKLLDNITDFDPTFYPVFELNGQLYGYTPVSKMTIGEYTDLERLSKNSVDNLEEIMAILYRPITKHTFGGLKWIFKNTYKIALGEAENLFRYYETKEYSNRDRVLQAELMKDIPASFAMGALSFFLVLGTTSLVSSKVSSLRPKQQMEIAKAMTRRMDTMNIGGGLQLFITSLQHPSLISQEKKLSLNSTLSSVSTFWPTNRIKQKESVIDNDSLNKILTELDND